MECPSCGAKSPDGKRFCGDCGAAIALLRPPEEQQHENQVFGKAKMARRLRLVKVAAVLVVVVVLAAITVSVFLIQSPSPEEVLTEWVERMNCGDPKGAADLTIYSKMDRESYYAQIGYLATIVADMGAYRLILNLVEDYSGNDLTTEDWYSSLPDLASMLGAQYHITIDDTMGVYCSITFYDNGEATVVNDSWPAFKVGSSWYLAYGLV